MLHDTIDLPPFARVAYSLITLAIYWRLQSLEFVQCKPFHYPAGYVGLPRPSALISSFGPLSLCGVIMLAYTLPGRVSSPGAKSLVTGSGHAVLDIGTCPTDTIRVPSNGRCIGVDEILSATQRVMVFNRQSTVACDEIATSQTHPSIAERLKVADCGGCSAAGRGKHFVSLVGNCSLTRSRLSHKCRGHISHPMLCAVCRYVDFTVVRTNLYPKSICSNAESQTYLSQMDISGYASQ